MYIQVYTDNIDYNNPLNISYIGPFGSDFIYLANLIFPLPHLTEFTHIDITSQAEPFRQYICFKGPVKLSINTSDYLYNFVNSYSIFSVIRTFSKSLLYPKSFDLITLINDNLYDPYLYDMDTRASLYMNLASKELTPLDINF